MNRRGLFITGTDTDVGKTWVAARLVAELRRRGIDAVGMKPIECGGHDDRDALLTAAAEAGLRPEEVNPIHLPDPLAPAAFTEPVEIDFADLAGRLASLQAKSDFVIVEGAGGWLVPLDENRTVADLGISLDLPVLVVASNRLGVLNHTLLTVEAVRTSGLPCAGVFLNTFEPEDLSQRSNGTVLSDWLGEIPLFEDDLDELADVLVGS